MVPACPAQNKRGKWLNYDGGATIPIAIRIFPLISSHWFCMKSLINTHIQRFKRNEKYFWKF